MLPTLPFAGTIGGISFSTTPATDKAICDETDRESQERNLAYCAIVNTTSQALAVVLRRCDSERFMRTKPRQLLVEGLLLLGQRLALFVSPSPGHLPAKHTTFPFFRLTNSLP